MRTFSYVLLGIVVFFILNVTISLVFPVYRSSLVSVRTNLFGEKFVTTQDKKNEEEDTTSRLIDSLERIDKHIEAISSRPEPAKNNSPEIVYESSGGVLSLSQSGMTGGLSVTTVMNAPIKSDVPLSGLFLAKIMPEISLKKVENSGIFSIYIFDKIPYTTYIDEKKQIKVYAFGETYDTILSNLKLASSIYTINETDQFFGYTFFLNPTKKDTTIRFVTALEGRAIGVECESKYYKTLKTLLLKQ